MTHPADMITKGIASLAMSGILMVIDQLKELPAIIRDLGIPVAFAIFALAGVWMIAKQLREMTDGRIDDGKEYADKLERQIEEGLESRVRLIAISEKMLALNEKNHELTAEQLKALAKNSIAIERLANQLQSRPCQK